MLTMRIMPKMSERPPASRKSKAPYDTPLKSWPIQNSTVGQAISTAGARVTARDCTIGTPGARTAVVRAAADVAGRQCEPEHGRGLGPRARGEGDEDRPAGRGGPREKSEEGRVRLPHERFDYSPIAGRRPWKLP